MVREGREERVIDKMVRERREGREERVRDKMIREGRE